MPGHIGAQVDLAIHQLCEHLGIERQV
jgi:hypothetical protein